MKIPKQILIFLTVLVSFIFIILLFNSFQEEQIQGDLEIYQSNLILQASEYKFKGFAQKRSTLIRQSIFGNNLYDSIEKQYQKVIDENIKFKKSLTIKSNSESEIANINLTTIENNIAKLYLNLGILEYNNDQLDKSVNSFKHISSQSEYSELAQALSGFKLNEASYQLEININKHLKGWFRYSVLKSLYKQKDRAIDLQNLEKTEELSSLIALFRLILISFLPALGIVIGIGIILFIVLKYFLSEKESFASFARFNTWQVPWSWEIVLQVFVVGFFLLSQGIVYLILPFILKQFDSNIWNINLISQAIKILLTYSLMAATGLGFLYFSVKPFLPLDKEWFAFKFKERWYFQAILGYFVALPLVVLVSLINQQIWQGKGGSNPLLFLAIEANNGWVIFIFFITACIAAPFYEEILFRGFLLPSLTSYFPTWISIILSSLFFALAHLNLSEVLPLSILGMILGFVYQRSRNLLSSILLHSLWNTGTLLSLFLLGNA